MIETEQEKNERQIKALENIIKIQEQQVQDNREDYLKKLKQKEGLK
jgi:hypothetical protein